MTDKEKNKIVDILLDFYDEYYSNEINRPMIPSIYAGKILEFIDSLQEEPVSEALEEAANFYADTHTEWFDADNNPHVSPAFKAGANWQKEQFEKNRLAACCRQTKEEAEIESDFVMGIIEKEHRQPTFDDAIKYGMRLHKEKMMAKAVDGDITFDYYGDDDKTYGCIAHDSFCLEDFGLKDRDKVKVIVVKED